MKDRYLRGMWVGLLISFVTGFPARAIVDHWISEPAERKRWERDVAACQFAGYDTAVIDADGSLFCTDTEDLVLYEVGE